MKITRTYSRTLHVYRFKVGKGRRAVVAEVYKALPPGADPDDPDPRMVWYVGGCYIAGPYRSRGDAFRDAEDAVVAQFSQSDTAGPQRAGRRDQDPVIGNYTPGPLRQVPVGIDIHTGEPIPLECIAPEYHEQALREQAQARTAS